MQREKTPWEIMEPLKLNFLNFYENIKQKTILTENIKQIKYIYNK